MILFRREVIKSQRSSEPADKIKPAHNERARLAVFAVFVAKFSPDRIQQAHKSEQFSHESVGIKSSDRFFDCGCGHRNIRLYECPCAAVLKARQVSIASTSPLGTTYPLICEKFPLQLTL